MQASASNWSRDSDEAANQLCVSNSSKRRYLEETPVVPEKQSDIGAGVSQNNDLIEVQLRRPIRSENSSPLPRVASHELNNLERDSAISRYKEKKKARRYNHYPLRRTTKLLPPSFAEYSILNHLKLIKFFF